MGRDHWIELMGRQWMSVLHSFSDDEIAAGQDEVRQRHPEWELQFADRFAFVLDIRADAPGSAATDAINRLRRRPG